jgi:hypothetical protein
MIYDASTEKEPQRPQPPDAADAIGHVDFEALYREATELGIDLPAELDNSPIYRGPDLAVAQLQLIIHERLEQLGSAPSSPEGVIDLTGSDPAAVLKTLNALTGDANILLHGGKTKQLVANLDPSFSMQQTHKPPVVNATTDAQTAAFYATIDMSGFNTHLPPATPTPNFGVGLNVYGDTGPERPLEVEVDSLSKAVFEAHGNDPTLYADGYIYILNRHDFTPSSLSEGQQSSDHEWSSTKVVEPIAIIKVSHTIGRGIITRANLASNMPASEA